MLESCVFCKISEGSVLSQRVYEDSEVFAFKDINPQAPVHVIVIPKRHISSLNTASREDESILGRIQVIMPEVAKRFSEMKNGFRVVSNCGFDGGQTIFHVHYHLLGGRTFAWPPG
jgi:histidine triad (HIT) family protein